MERSRIPNGLLACLLALPVSTARAEMQEIDDPGVHLVEPARQERVIVAPVVVEPIVPKAGSACGREAGSGVGAEARDCAPAGQQKAAPARDDTRPGGYEAGIHVEDRASRVPDRRGR